MLIAAVHETMDQQEQKWEVHSGRFVGGLLFINACAQRLSQLGGVGALRAWQMPAPLVYASLHSECVGDVKMIKY